MRFHWVLMGLALLGLSACGSNGPLTQSQAQRTIDEWVKSIGHIDPVVLSGADLVRAVDSQVMELERSGVRVTDQMYADIETNLKNLKKPLSNAVKVSGVRDIPAESSAIADLDMTQLYWDTDGILRLPSKSASGQASFKHYTDGRWVLASVSWNDGRRTVAPNLTVR